MPQPALLIVTGASGAGKTASVEALAARALPGMGCFFFDHIGVPDPEAMIRDFGGGDAWQAWATRRWIARLRAETAHAVAVLDGQVRPSVVRAALREAGLDERRAAIVLLDCAPEERARRLAGPRGQPELASARMDAWAAYLRGQADALELPVIDTTGRPLAAVADALAEHAARLRASAERPSPEEP
jgi:hypothetical protein